jgi:type 1 glutamine amidotransferase
MTTVEEAYADVERLTRARARNFAYGIMLLPKWKRRAIAAIYAFAREVDDVADDPGLDDATKRERLEALRTHLDGDEARGSMYVALADARRRYPIPSAALHHLVDGGLHFPTAEELRNIDVIVMYKGDAGYMTPREKAVLEDYLRDGGGLVGFHDAICAEDAEWFATIFGGAKKHGQVNYTLDAKIPYTVADKANPITQGMTETKLEDETYKNLWISPQVKVLLRTDEKTSDGPIAWISPYEKSKVVYLQPGHGRTAHEHPAYRR